VRATQASCLLGVLYGCGLRCHEARSLMINDVDFDRNMLHVRQGKGRNDRYVTIGENLCRGIKVYLSSKVPHKWLFNGKINMKAFHKRECNG
jgi:integrase/recombinase XerD